VPGVKVFKDGHAVSRISDFIIYSVEAEFIGKVVAEYGPCQTSFFNLKALADSCLSSPTATKVGAIVAGQTSVKAPEREAFEKDLPDDVHILSIHSLHGPTVATKGQPLVSHLSCSVSKIDVASRF
jgi:prephenate dehydrogenase (NADP+)